MEIEKSLSKEDTIVFLRQLAYALEKNLALNIGDTSISISPALEISLEYEENGDESELEIEFNWTRTDRPKRSKFEIFEAKNGGWYFRLKARNGQTILASQKYTTKQGAEKGIASIKKNVRKKNIEFRSSPSEQRCFVLKATNGEIIGTSQMYKRKASCEKGARAVLNITSAAEVTVVE